MKIAFLNIYSGLVDRGAETFLNGLASQLAKKHQIVVFQAGRARGNEEYQIKKIPVSLDWKKKNSTGTLKRKLFIDYWSIKILFFTLKTLKELYKKKYDLVVPLNGGWQPALIRIVTWLYGGKMLISGHSGMGWDDVNNLWSFPNTFIALSTKAKKWAKKINPLIKVKYIPNGVDLKKFTKEGKSISTKLKKPIILCVSAFTKTKRVELVIKAAAKLKDVSLLLVGDGDQKDNLTYLAEKLLKNRHKFMKVPFEEMPTIYRAADLFTIASEDYYSFEIVIAEAIATNLPAVVNDDLIRREIVGDAGLFVNPLNTEKYAESINKALKLDWHNKPREQAKKFSWDKIAKEYEKIFVSLLK